jgi:cysteinyl-tRNA synthetase
MPIQLYDTLSQRLQPLEPMTPGRVGIYVCGATVYDLAHLGHMRARVCFDVLVRHLRERGLQVKYVRNITDVNERISQRAIECGEEPAALALRIGQTYTEDDARLNLLVPDLEPKVSEHMPQIIALIARLIEKGAAYLAEGDVYFSVESFPEYGKLSHRKLEDLEQGASGRVNEDETRRKRHPADFALWKGAKSGEAGWESPWGPGFPGWHIECSAMCMEHLGETCDLHGGGLDLVFPHHENEIAQSESATGKPFVKTWVHNGFVEVNKEKMSKSLGNFFTVRECFKFAEPEAIRYFVLSAHYRAPINLDFRLDERGNVVSFPQLDEAERRVEYLYSTRQRLTALPTARIDEAGTKVDSELKKFGDKLAQALDDDLKLPEALAVVADFLKRVNDGVDAATRKSGKLPRAAQKVMDQGFATIARVLGLGWDEGPAFLARVRARRLAATGMEAVEVERKIAERITARTQKDFARADQIRDELAAIGVELMDGPNGTDWRMK